LQRLPYNYMFCQGYVIQEDAYILEKRLSYALSLADRISQIQLPSKSKATIDAYQGDIFSPCLKRGCLSYYGRLVGMLYSIRRGLLRCSFYGNGQCESQGLRDE